MRNARHVIERRDRGARRDQRTRADLADAEHAGERRADHPVGEVRADLRDLGAGGIAGGALRIQRGTRDQLLPRELLLPLVQLLGLLQRRLGGRQQGLLLLAAEGDQRRPARNGLPALEVDLLHGLADLGGDGHRLARTHGAERAQRIGPVLLAHHFGGHRDRAIPASAGATLRTGCAALAAGDEHEEQARDEAGAAERGVRHGAARSRGSRF